MLEESPYMEAAEQEVAPYATQIPDIHKTGILSAAPPRIFSTSKAITRDMIITT